jgi:transcriptional regulator with XRE-family HTH domain
MLDSPVSFDAVVFAGDADVAGKPTLRQVRISKLLSANELWRLSGIAPSTILKIEAGAKPRLSTIRKLATALEMSPTEIEWPGDPLGEADTPGQENG